MLFVDSQRRLHDGDQVHGFTALMIAVRDCRPSCVKLLIRKGARINLSRNRVRIQEKHRVRCVPCIRANHAANLPILIQSRGTTALHIAARSGHDECCSILIDGGAELDTLSVSSMP
jgi:ankyrin repeat protein